MLTGTLQVTHTYLNERFKAIAEVVAGTCPRPVFLYRNKGESEELTEFLGVCDMAQVTSVPQWEPGVSSPTFGVPFVRHTQGIQMFNTEEEITAWTEVLRHDIKVLMTTIDHVAPVVETYEL